MKVRDRERGSSSPWYQYMYFRSHMAWIFFTVMRWDNILCTYSASVTHGIYEKIHPKWIKRMLGGFIRNWKIGRFETDYMRIIDCVGRKKPICSILLLISNSPLWAKIYVKYRFYAFYHLKVSFYYQSQFKISLFLNWMLFMRFIKSDSKVLS